jgi:hypothetical protein
MCGTVLVYLILLTPAIGSLVGLRSKICCHLAWWKVSKRTVMRFGTWANLHVRVHRRALRSGLPTAESSRPFGMGTLTILRAAKWRSAAKKRLSGAFPDSTYVGMSTYVRF